MAAAERSFKETPKSSRADMKSPTAARVEAKATRLFISLFGNSTKLALWETLASWLPSLTAPGCAVFSSCNKC